MLALALGRTLKEVDDMRSDEFNEWLAFYSVSPFGETRDDMRGAMLCSVVSNVMGAKTKPSDYMPDFFGDRAPASRLASANSLRAMAQRINASMGVG